MRAQRIVMLLVLLAGMSACTVWKDKPPSQWSQASGGEHLERLLWRDLSAKKWELLRQRMSATYVYLSPDGAHDRDSTLELLRQFEIGDYTLGDFQVRASAPDVIVTYTATVRGKFDGRSFSPQSRRILAVWQHTDQGWIATARTEMPTADTTNAAAPR